MSEADATNADERTETLFRLEPTQNRYERRLYGDGGIRQPRIRTVTSIVAILGIATCAIVLGAADYTKTSVAYGQISAIDGITRLRPHQPGTVVRVLTKDGDFVRSGQRLFMLSSDRVLGDNLSVTSAVNSSLTDRLSAAMEEARLKHEISRNRRDEIKDNIRWTEQEASHLRQELASLKRSAAMERKLLKRSELAHGTHLISTEQLELRQISFEDKNLKEIAQEREISRTKSRLASLKSELEKTTEEAKLNQAISDQKIAAIRQEMSETASRFEDSVLAPHDGILSSVTTQAGQAVDSSSTLAVLTRDGDISIAHIYVTGRAIEHLHRGDTVSLEHEGMDAKLYGTYKATVTNVPRAPMTTSELSSIAGAIPRDASDPYNPLFFDVTVEFPMNSGERQAMPRLHLGTTVKAVLPIKTQKIYQWLLDPLRLAKSRQQAHGRT